MERLGQQVGDLPRPRQIAQVGLERRGDQGIVIEEDAQMWAGSKSCAACPHFGGCGGGLRASLPTGVRAPKPVRAMNGPSIVRLAFVQLILTRPPLMRFVALALLASSTPCARSGRRSERSSPFRSGSTILLALDHASLPAGLDVEGFPELLILRGDRFAGFLLEPAHALSLRRSPEEFVFLVNSGICGKSLRRRLGGAPVPGGLPTGAGEPLEKLSGAQRPERDHGSLGAAGVPDGGGVQHPGLRTTAARPWPRYRRPNSTPVEHW